VRKQVQAKTDPLWERPCQAIQLQALPTQDNLVKLQSLQNRLDHVTPIKLLKIPVHSLHCTILTLLHPAQTLDRPKFDIWNEHAKDWTAAISDAVSAAAPFSLHFRRAVASEMAIFVQADVPPVLQRIRSEMAQAIEYRGQHPKAPDIAHITIARYSEVGSVPDLQGVAEGLPLTLPVERLRLIKETVYPTLDHQEIGQFSLLDVEVGRQAC